MHLAIVMDGNRRWASEHMLPGIAGHRKGAQKVKEAVKWCKERQIEILTLYAFSTENWRRPPGEVFGLMQLFDEALEREMQELHQEKVRLLVIGQRERLAVSLERKIAAAENLTKDNKGITLVVALSYGGRAEIVEAIKKIMRLGIPSEKISWTVPDFEENRKGIVYFGDYLYTAGLPDPDLIIRTAGEQRLSNFLSWQSAYSEFYVCQSFWPDFSERDLDYALEEYAKRQRRSGK